MYSGSRFHRQKEPPELNITAFLNLMVVLVPFLLITAVFSQITILQLNIPKAGSANDSNKKDLQIEVVVRENSVEVGDGRKIIKRIKNNDKGYDIRKLSKTLLAIKNNYPDKRNATILLEPEIEYGILVKMMDAVGGAEVVQAASVVNVELFPEISIGDAFMGKAKKAKGKK